VFVLFHEEVTYDYIYKEVVFRFKLLIVAVCCRLATERDAAERDSREKETKILNQSRELEELQNRLADAERVNQQQQTELSELMSSKDDVGKNVSLCGFNFSVSKYCV